MENQTLKNNVRFFRCSTKIERSRREGLFNIDSYWTSVVYVRSVGMLGLIIYALIFDIEYPSRTPFGVRLVVLALPAMLETAGLVGLLKRKPYLLTGPILMQFAFMATNFGSRRLCALEADDTILLCLSVFARNFQNSEIKFTKMGSLFTERNEN